MTYRKKLIEVALPLEAINEESSRRKRKAPAGYPTTLHKWWAQRPLAACRAVLFASLVDDPSSRPDEFPTEEDQERERQRLFHIIEDLIKWENSNNGVVLQQARNEILKSTEGRPPLVRDPFAGGGSIPLEAQRLGLEVHASDLNPVAVLINKALIEIPPRFVNQLPVNPEAHKKLSHSSQWKGTQGLAEDILYYGKWMRDEASSRIGHLYPKMQLPKEYGGGEALVIAWLWARTITCPNPACGVHMPLVRSFALSTKKGSQTWIEPIVDRDAKIVRFEMRSGNGTLPRGTVNRRGAYCILCDTTVTLDYIRSEGKAGRIGLQMMAIVVERQRRRIYLLPDNQTMPTLSSAETTIVEIARESFLASETPRRLTGGTCYIYGLTTWGSLFMPRQLVALTTFCDLLLEVREQMRRDVRAIGLTGIGMRLAEESQELTTYVDAVTTYLAFAISRAVDYNSTLATWRAKDNAMRSTLSKQAIPMVWDFAEGNPLTSSSSGFFECCKVVAKCLEYLPSSLPGIAFQQDARNAVAEDRSTIFCTDPPYYNNISYADLADFFHVWLRRSLSSIFPTLLSTLLTPKAEELVATSYRFGGNYDLAQTFFQGGLEQAFKQMYKYQDPAYPVTVFYAFKQTETDDEVDTDGIPASFTASTGWETILEGLIRSGFSINGTWPMRTEGDNRQVGQGSNALASSIVLVCRPRPENAPVATRREFIAALRRELPDALRKLQHGNIAPVDLAQAAIGPGMAVFSRYSSVVESDGTSMRVRTALQLINQALDEVLAEQEGEYDNDTRWALAWFEQYGINEGPYGVAETLSKAKNTSISGLVEGGILQAKGGKVKLLSRDELPRDWKPSADRRLSVWEVTQYLIRALEKDGEYGAASVLVQVGALGETALDLAYRLYTTSERKGWAQEALAYNSLVVAWPNILEQQAAQPGIVAQARIEF
jgi:putative DNA methylase